MSDRQSTERKTDRTAIQRRLHLREVSSEFEDANYDGIGSDLKATRVRNGLDLVSVARTLRIRLEYLMALEEGRFADLPGSVYAIGFVRTYAEYLDIDGEAAVDAYKQETSGLRAETKLLFPTPEPENRMPKGWLIGLSLALFVLIYAGWYYAENKDQFVIEPVAQVPERLAAAEATATPPRPAVRTEPPAPAKPAEPAEPVQAAAPSAVPTQAPEPEPESGPVAQAEPQTQTLNQTQPQLQPQPQPQPQVAVQVPAVAETEAEAAPAVAPAPEATETRPSAVVEQSESQSPEPQSEARTETSSAPQAELQGPTENQASAPSVAESQTPEGISRRLLSSGEGQTLQGPSPASVPVDVVAYPLPSRPRTALAAPASETATQLSPTAVEQAPAASQDQPVIVEPAPPAQAPAIATEQVAAVAELPAPSPPPAAPSSEAQDPQNLQNPQNPSQSASVDDLNRAATVASPESTERVPQIYGAGNWNARVVVQARADAWVQVTTETGDLLLTRVMRDGDKFLAPPRDDIVLTTGNAGALEIFVDGNRLPKIGGLGEVARNLPLSADWLMARLRTDR